MSESSVGRLRVIEIAEGVVAAACGRLFAGLGHDVVKCEPRTGDALRRQAPLNAHGESLEFTALNADKSSVVADVDDPADRPTIEALLDSANVALIDVAALPAWLSPAAIQQRWPALVTVLVTDTGQDGGSDFPRDSLLAESYGGLASMIGDPAQRPLALGGEQTAYASACAAFFACMVGLRQVAVSGVGEVVDLATVDVAAYMDWKSDVGLLVDPEPPTRRGSDRGDWRIVRATDGWVGVIYQPWQWQKMVDLVGDERLSDPAFADQAGRRTHADQFWSLVESWVAARTKLQVYQEAQAAGLPFGFSADVADLVRSAQLRDRGFLVGPDQEGRTPALGAPFSCDALSWRTGPAPALGGGPPRTDVPPVKTAAAGNAGSPPTAGPLSGLVVLDFGTITAGAAATRLLADFGATVISVESLDHPDPFRAWKSDGNNSPYFPSNNVWKSGIVVDLKSGEGRELVHQLVGQADVLVENYRVGVTARLGIDPETLLRLNPELVYLSMSSQGQNGPEAGNSSYGSTIDLLSGLASVTGYDEGHPMWSSSDVNYPDQIVSLLGAGLVLYSILNGHRGAHLDMSQREVVTWTLGAYVADHLLTGRVAAPQGNRRPSRSPRDTYPCAEPDTWVALSCHTDGQRAALAALIDLGPCPADESWWVQHADDVDGAISEWTSARPQADCVALLQQQSIPAVPVLTALDRRSNPRFTQRRVRLDDLGPVPVKGFPFVSTVWTPGVPTPAPGLGQDTRQVLSQRLGLTNTQIDDLHVRGVVHCQEGTSR